MAVTEALRRHGLERETPFASLDAGSVPVRRGFAEPQPQPPRTAADVRPVRCRMAVIDRRAHRQMPAGVIEFLFVVVNSSTSPGSPGTFDPFQHQAVQVRHSLTYLGNL
jgi:hypothetical protein